MTRLTATACQRFWSRSASLCWALGAAVLLLATLSTARQLDQARGRHRARLAFERAAEVERWLREQQGAVLGCATHHAVATAARWAAAPGSGVDLPNLWLHACRNGIDAIWVYDAGGRLVASTQHSSVPEPAVGDDLLRSAALDGPLGRLGATPDHLRIEAAAPVRTAADGPPAGVVAVAARLDAARLAGAEERSGGRVTAIPSAELVRTEELQRCRVLGPESLADPVIARASALGGLDDPDGGTQVFLQFVGRGGGSDGLLAIYLPEEPFENLDGRTLAAFALAACLGLWLAASLLPPFGPRLLRGLRRPKPAAPPLSEDAADALVHHLQNALSVVLANARLLAERADDPLTRGSLADVIQAARRSSRLVNRLRRAAQRSPLPWRRSVDVAEAYAVALRRARRLTSLQRTPTVTGLDGLLVAGLRDDVIALLVALLENAFEATGDDARITVRARRVGDFAEISVRDNGPGLDSATARWAREPFYTTRGPAHAGLGLSVVEGVVTRHGGRWHLHSAPGEGCTVWVELPLWTDEDEPAAV